MDMDNELDARKYGLDINDMLPILNSIGQAIFIDDAEGYALWINKACEEIYRINKEDVIGKHCTYLEHMGIFAPSVARRVLEEKGKLPSYIKTRTESSC